MPWKNNNTAHIPQSSMAAGLAGEEREKLP